MGLFLSVLFMWGMIGVGKATHGASPDPTKNQIQTQAPLCQDPRAAFRRDPMCEAEERDDLFPFLFQVGSSESLFSRARKNLVSLTNN